MSRDYWVQLICLIHICGLWWLWIWCACSLSFWIHGNYFFEERIAPKNRYMIFLKRNMLWYFQKKSHFCLDLFLSVLALLQSKHDEMEAKFIEERAVLEAKYQKLYEPLYSKVSSSIFIMFFGKLLIVSCNNPMYLSSTLAWYSNETSWTLSQGSAAAIHAVVQPYIHIISHKCQQWFLCSVWIFCLYWLVTLMCMKIAALWNCYRYGWGRWHHKEWRWDPGWTERWI